MICQITQSVIDVQGLDQSSLGMWLAVLQGHPFIFDTKEIAIATRAMIRNHGKIDRMVH